MMRLREIRAALSDRNLGEVSRRLGMNRQQLWAIANGLTANPTARTLERISDYLTGENEGGADDSAI